jgi:hypothetical protein
MEADGVVAGNEFSRMTDRLRTDWQRRQNTRAEAPYRREFLQFYQQLPDKRNIFYMFFTGGLLHWVAKSLSYVPDDVNLVLLGSALSEADQEWVRDTVAHPFYHLRPRINDKIAWSFLFDANEQNFGWLDIDCLVLNGKLFDEMTCISADDLLNGAWWYDTGFGFFLAATYFQFINIRAVAALRASRLGVSPNCYSFHPVICQTQGGIQYSEALTRRLRRQLLKIVPPDESGLPSSPEREGPYFDTMIMPQLIARTLGFGGHKVRHLQRRGPGGTGYSFEEISDELVHIGGVSYGSDVTDFSKLYRNPGIRLRYLLGEMVALDAADGLPDAYAKRRKLVVAELGRLGMTPAAAKEAAHSHLTEERGLTTHAARLAINRLGAAAT